MTGPDYRGGARLVLRGSRRTAAWASGVAAASLSAGISPRLTAWRSSRSTRSTCWLHRLRDQWAQFSVTPLR